MSQLATQLTNGIQQQLQGAIGTITGAVSALGQAIVNMDAAALQAAFGRITGLIGGVFGQLQQAGQAVFERITGLWNGLQGRFNEVLGNLTNRASEIFGQLQSAAQSVRQRLTSAWDALQSRASQLSGVLGGVLERLRSLVDRLLSWGQQIWNGIQQQWTGLQGRLQDFLQGVRQQITNALQGLRQRAMAMWNQVRGVWNQTQTWVRQQVQRLANGVRSIWSRIQNFQIGAVIEKIAKFAPFIRLIQQAVADPDAAMQPMVDAIAGKLSAEMPGKATELGQQHIQQGRGGGDSATATQSTQPTANGLIQRTPLVAGGTVAKGMIQRHPDGRATTSISEIWHGFVRHLSAKWQALDLWKMVKDMLWNLIWPWPAIGRELSELFTKDLPGIVGGLFSPRTTGILDFLHDLWTNLLHLLDVPLVIWRRINSIGMHLMGWITAGLTILGAIGGSVAGGVIGGILSAAVSLGIATPAGAAGGAGAGGLGGAGAGFAAAMAIGQGLLVSFVVAEGAMIAKTLAELWTGRQTDDEKEADYSQLADSLIGLGVTAALVMLAWIASRLASAIVGFIREIRASRVPPPDAPPPSTEPPGTEPPGTEPPGTEPPGTEPPGTEPPGTEPPGTEPPGTEPPGTEPPGTEPPGTEPPGSERPPTINPPPRTLAELRAQMSEAGRTALNQQRELFGDQAVEGQARRFLREDGTYDVQAADEYFRNRQMTPEEYAERLRVREERSWADAETQIERVDNIIRETSPEGRPGATIGDGTSEAALTHEAQTGQPVGGRGHSQKVAGAVNGLGDAVSRLRQQLGRISDTARRVQIEDAISRAEQKLNQMRPALEQWRNRVTDRPDIWNPDGTSKTYTNPDGSPWPPPNYR